MRRNTTYALLGIAVISLSCGVRTQLPSELPLVSAAPPAGELSTAPVDPEFAQSLAQLEAYLERYAMGLTRAEIAAVARTILVETKRHDINPRLVLAVMYVESRFYNFAVSEAEAMGLMQIMPATGEELAARLEIPWRGPQTLFDPVANVRMGIAYLRELSSRYDHLPTVLAAYNWGPGRIDRRLRRGSPVPQQYSRLVLEAYASTRHDERRS
jgi:soluble lytic murein transglycosylase-like protein